MISISASCLDPKNASEGAAIVAKGRAAAAAHVDAAVAVLVKGSNAERLLTVAYALSAGGPSGVHRRAGDIPGSRRPGLRGAGAHLQHGHLLQHRCHSSLAPPRTSSFASCHPKAAKRMPCYRYLPPLLSCINGLMEGRTMLITFAALPRTKSFPVTIPRKPSVTCAPAFTCSKCWSTVVTWPSGLRGSDGGDHLLKVRSVA